MKNRLKKLSENSVVVGIVIFLIALLTAFAASNNPLTVGRTVTDSSVFHYVARVIRKGGMPYRDTFDHKGPLIYLIDVLGQIMNPSIGVWILELCFIFVAAIYAYKLARLFGAGKWSSVFSSFVLGSALTYYFEGGNMVEEYAATFIIIALYVFAKYFLKKNVKWYDLSICGGSFAAVCLLRVNMVALWVVMCIGVLIDCIRNKQAKKVIWYLLWFLVGATMVFLPIVFWLVKGGALKAFFEDYFLFNLKYTSDKERSGLGQFIEAVITFCRGLPVILAGMFLVHYALERRRLFEWLCVASLGFSLIMMCISGQSYGHYGMILCPLIACAFALALGEITLNEPGKEVLVTLGEKTRKYRIIVIKVVVLIPILFIVSRNRPTFLTEFDLGLEDIVNVIVANSTEEERITVCGNHDIVYLQSNRMSSSIYSYQDPIASVSPKIKEQYIQDVKSPLTVLLVIGTSSSWHKELDYIIEAQYELVEKVHDTEIYRRKE